MLIYGYLYIWIYELWIQIRILLQGYINDMTKELPEPWELDDHLLEKGEYLKLMVLKQIGPKNIGIGLNFFGTEKVSESVSKN